MRIISRPPLIEFGRKHPPAVGPLNDWWKNTVQANCQSYHELKNVFNSVDSIGNDRYVFNIAGNNYRLVAMIHFRLQKVYIRAVLTHTEYDYHNRNDSLRTL